MINFEIYCYIETANELKSCRTASQDVQEGGPAH